MLLLLLPGTCPGMELSQGYRSAICMSKGSMPRPVVLCVCRRLCSGKSCPALTVSDTFSQMRVLVEEGGAFMGVTDRWGNTPLVEANRSGARPCASYLESRLFTQQKGAIYVDCLCTKSLAYAGRATPDPVLKCSWSQTCHVRCQRPWV